MSSTSSSGNNNTMKFVDVSELSAIENLLRASNEVFADRQLRVKLETYIQDFEEVQLNKLAIEKVKQVKKKRKTSADVSVSSSTTIEEGKINVKDKCIVPRITIWRGKHPRRKLFRELISTLNAAFTDYDFSSVKINQFQRLSLAQVMRTVKSRFLELTANANKQKADSEVVAKVIMQDLWVTIGHVVGTSVIDLTFTNVEGQFGLGISNMELFHATLESMLLGVEIYTYVVENETEIDADPLSNLGNLWSMNYFFCNADTGKIILLACSCRQRKFSQSGSRQQLLDMNNPVLDNELSELFALDSFAFEDATDQPELFSEFDVLEQADQAKGQIMC